MRVRLRAVRFRRCSVIWCWTNWTGSWSGAGITLYATPTIVCHERERPKGRVACNCLTDEGRPLGTGLQGQVPNHLRRLWSKAMVVSTEGKRPGKDQVR